MFTLSFVNLTMFNIDIRHHDSIKMTEIYKKHVMSPLCCFCGVASKTFTFDEMISSMKTFDPKLRLFLMHCL